MLLLMLMICLPIYLIAMVVKLFFYLSPLGFLFYLLRPRRRLYRRYFY